MNVSVIVPFYNAEKTITRTLCALKNQDMEDIEFILVDNGSTDRSANICREYVENDKRFVYVFESKRGVSIARNKGLDAAKGKYICFCDADDIPDKSMYRTLFEDISKTKSDMAMCNYYTERDNNHSSFPISAGKILSIEEIRLQFIPAMFHSNNRESVVWGTVWRSIFKTSLIKNNSLYFDEKLTFAEDLCFILQYLIYVKSLVLEDKSLYYYVCNENSAMMSFKTYKPGLFIERVYLIETIKSLLENFGIYSQYKNVINNIFQEYILECIGNTSIRANENSFFHSYKQISTIIKHPITCDIFRTIQNEDKKKKIVFELIRRRNVFVLLVYYRFRNRY